MRGSACSKELRMVESRIAPRDKAMPTTLELLAQMNDHNPTMSVEVVCERFFAPLSIDMFKRKLASGEIPLPVMTMGSQKGAKLIHVADLAKYLDQVAEQARKELAKLN